MAFMEKRKEYRINLDTVALTIIGSRERDAFAFDYVFYDISMHGAQVLITSPVPKTKGFREGDIVCLHAFLASDGKYSDRGVVRWSRLDSAAGTGVLLGLELTEAVTARPAVSISLETSGINFDTDRFDSPEQMLSTVIDDVVAVQKKLSLSIDSLAKAIDASTPVRIKERLLTVLKKVNDNYGKVKEFGRLVHETIASGQEELPKTSSLDELSSLAVLGVSTKIPRALRKVKELVPYIRAVRDIEQDLYAAHNTITLLCMGFLIMETQELLFSNNGQVTNET